MKQDIINDFKIILKKEGMKITPQRLAVLEQFVDDNQHRESEEIYMSLKQQDIYVSRATVYRTLDLLVQNDLIRKLDIGDGRYRYESKFGQNNHHHDHMICNKCGIIIEFVDSIIETRQDQIALENNFLLKRHIHQLFGLCKECQE